MNITVALFVLLCVAQLADVYTTLRALRQPGAVEGNPVLVKLLGKSPKAAGLLAVKLIVLAGAFWELSSVGWVASSGTQALVAFLAAFLFVVAFNNLRLARKLESKNRG